ncbi:MULTISPECIES: helix-turn-helix domain-containing protein [unclassified Anaerobiospirillum]|uniref:helix-turn-helix domain-containing protein n=1 Tax=unclassified Anaerobiospirillum TaxID=2647410 RepID=UPI001FF5AF33|nr:MULTISPECIES: helix-turn-helix domain-containing protein [unclassified Anaerobiospirillum]MCK0535328.1 helix-turn-helix domain-containing protein [Anaerobiospirillum sp. NML120511]MCK0540573.1 helix-turn-helix domain-containing protein [Anaerobiospirillum sp. NML02-A-032]
MNQTSLDKTLEASAIQAHPDFQRIRKAVASSASSRLRERYEVILKFAELQSISKVSSELGLDRKTVRKWLSRFQEKGMEGLADKPRSGRKTVLSDSKQDMIDNVVEKRLTSDSPDEARDVKSIANYLNLPYHPVLRYLKSKGINVGDLQKSMQRKDGAAERNADKQSAARKDTDSSDKK